MVDDVVLLMILMMSMMIYQSIKPMVSMVGNGNDDRTLSMVIIIIQSIFNPLMYIQKRVAVITVVITMTIVIVIELQAVDHISDNNLSNTSYYRYYLYAQLLDG